MNPARDYSSPVIDAILHPTDFSDASTTAFHHALKAALIAKSRLTILHVTTGESREIMDFPAVRETLERWGLLPPDSPRSAVPKLGIDVRKVVAKRRKPVAAILQYIDEHPTDLIVLAAHQHQTWLRGSVAPLVAHRAGQMTLFVPEGNAGFVSAADGSITLTNILIPVAAVPDPQPAVKAAARLAARLHQTTGTFTLLHIGDAAAIPTVQCPDVPGWKWVKLTQSGEVIDGIVRTARDIDANLLVMATDGRHGFLDALRGSHTELILRQSHPPLLIVPVGSLAESNLQTAMR
jgi:nucleotide-binding universal stress UspA family protein